jgi:8-hydroxy-5-deazaflavin:NADPH oxidoreductase
MRIAILGAGNVGGGLAAAAVRAGHDVVISASKPESAESRASYTGATAARSNADAVRGADVVVLAVPHSAVAGIVAELGEALNGAIVVDATNPLNDTYTDLVTAGTSAAENLQQQLPGASVVKAFNTVLAGRLTNPTEGDTPLDGFLAGDDDGAKATVGRLLESLGFRPIDAGALRMARSLEELAFLNIALNAANGWAWQTGWKLVGPTASAS